MVASRKYNVKFTSDGNLEEWGQGKFGDLKKKNKRKEEIAFGLSVEDPECQDRRRGF